MLSYRGHLRLHRQLRLDITSEKCTCSLRVAAWTAKWPTYQPANLYFCPLRCPGWRCAAGSSLLHTEDTSGAGVSDLLLVIAMCCCLTWARAVPPGDQLQHRLGAQRQRHITIRTRACNDQLPGWGSMFMWVGVNVSQPTPRHAALSGQSVPSPGWVVGKCGHRGAPPPHPVGTTSQN